MNQMAGSINEVNKKERSRAKKSANALQADSDSCISPAEEACTLIVTAGLKLTAQRRLIIRTVLESDPRARCKEIYLLAKKADKRVGVATVYRTMRLLEEYRIIERLHVGAIGRSLREIRGGAVICPCCGSIEELNDKKLLREIKTALESSELRGHGYKLLLCAPCHACRERCSVD